jgi:galactose-1-phosphate uridylyltransferase
MSLEFWEDQGRLVWVRNPFTGAVTYFTDVHKKPDGYREQGFVYGAGGMFPEARVERRSDPDTLNAACTACVFCPGNEDLTREEVLRVSPDEVPGAGNHTSPWLIRGFYNIVPRIPECCTGGRNESYVVVEDPRHFRDGTEHLDDLLCTADLPEAQFQALVRTAAAIARRSYANPAVKAVLIRKNQGPQSGASQPHLHTQVIGSHEIFPPVKTERDLFNKEPALLPEILDFVETHGLVIARERKGFLYFCPFGTFPRSYEVICPNVRVPISEAAPEDLDVFASLLHQALGVLGSLPLDYEIHDAFDLPLHAHISARHFPYSNIGGTLNLPALIPAAPRNKPHPGS